MHFVRVILGVILAAATLTSVAQETKPAGSSSAKPQKITVTGTLHRMMAIGAETSGWSIQLDEETTIDGKPMKAVEIAYPKAEELDKLVDKHVTAKGTVGHRHGVETGERVVLEVKKIKEQAQK